MIEKETPKADLLPKTPCCGYQWLNLPCPVMWNPFNNAVQCHNCGALWEPSPVAAPIRTPQPAAPSVNEGEDWERWAKEVCQDFRIPFDNHTHGIRAAMCEWMAEHRSPTSLGITDVSPDLKEMARECAEKCEMVAVDDSIYERSLIIHAAFHRIYSLGFKSGKESNGK